MTLYYFLGALLPELKIGLAPDIQFEEFVFWLKGNLNASDFKKTETLRLYFDIGNIRAFWSQLPLREEGNLDEQTLEEALLTRFGLPEYVYRFLDKYDSLETRKAHFAELQSSFFQEEIQVNEGFLKELLIQERKIQLVLAALRSKSLKQEASLFLQYEDTEDPLVRQILSQQDAEDYTPPSELEGLKSLYEGHFEEPLSLAQAVIEYRFAKVSEKYGLQVFTIDKILGYMFQLILAEGWMSLQKEKGQKIIHTILNEEQ